MEQGLVLAGGGVAGIAWELGMLMGIRDTSESVWQSLVESEVIIGTSAGSTVAAQISSGTPLDALYERQLGAADEEISPQFDKEELGAAFASALNSDASSGREILQGIGEMARRADTVSAEARRSVIEARLPSHQWPEQDLKITAIDVDSGELVIFDRDSGVDLVDAVAASCAVPGIWPTVAIGTHRFMDGGVQSAANISLGRTCRRVIVLAPSQQPGPNLLGGSLVAEAKGLTKSLVHIIFADEASVDAFGVNPLDPSTRRTSAMAGRSQGAQEALGLSEFLGITAPQ